VRPRPGPVAWARGQVPTPRGPLTVSWVTAAARTGFTLTITAPAGTNGDIAVPLSGTRAQVRVDGRLAWNNGMSHGFSAEAADGYVTLHAIPAGSHTITVTSLGQ